MELNINMPSVTPKMNPIETDERKIRRRIKKSVLFFVICLILSGITAFPIEGQLSLAVDFLNESATDRCMAQWLRLVHRGVRETNERFPFISYGTDWLAFAHLVIAIAFVGPLKDPLRNIWVIEFGMIACAGVMPMAFIAGEVRGIPVLWRLLDCMFGLIGGAILWRCHRDINQLKKINVNA